MFEDNNLWFFLFAVIPAILYSLFIYNRAPKGVVKKQTMWSYIIIGLVSIQILKMIHFLFPHIHSYVELYPVLHSIGEGKIVILEEPTIWAIFVFAFFQVAFFEELSKWFAFKVGNSIRGVRDIADSAFAVMFYSVMIAVGFAVFENIHYVGRVLWGDLQGVNPNEMLMIRSINSVVVHMLSGLFMGYFIALGKRRSNIIKRSAYTMLGLFTATLFHGVYDFNLMKGVNESDFINILGLDFHITNNIMIISALTIAWFMGKHLLKISYKK